MTARETKRAASGIRGLPTAEELRKATFLGRYGYAAYTSGRCADIQKRISRAHYEINKWEGTGRHEGVVSWYKGDLRNALRDRARYCSGGGAPGWRNVDAPYYDRYDPRYGDSYYDDGYSDPGFDWKRDWPLLLGLFMNRRTGPIGGLPGLANRQTGKNLN